MEYPVIAKPPVDQMPVRPNLPDVEAAREGFRWESVYEELDWLPGGYLNKAHECIDRHCEAGRGDKVALIWEGKNGEEESYTFAEFRDRSNQFANVLEGLGVGKGDRVFLFMERVPELYFALFGALKAGAIAGPLFSAFGADPVRDRLQDSGAVALVTQPDLRRRIQDILPDLPALKHIIIVNKLGRYPEGLAPGDLSYDDLMASASVEHETAATTMNDYSIMHYTSGTTGKPKGAVHRHLAIVQQYATGKWVLDLQEDDVYWCTADPGWVTGTSYGMFDSLVERRHAAHLRGRLRRGRVVPAGRKAQGDCLVHGADGHSHADEGGRRAARPIRPLHSATHQQRGRAPQPRGGGVGQQGLPPGHPRQLVADGDGGNPHRQLRLDGRAPRLHGRPLPGVHPAILDDDYNPLPPGQEGVWLSGRAGPPCSKATGATRSSTTPASARAGTSPETRPAWTRTATSGSWAASTT